jgi:DNA-binding transcriptional LysR family regulator
VQLNETLAFVAVVEAGSFTEAGRRLEVPKSTLSKQVSRLEERLGARLLQRSTRKLALTETGRAFFERCRPAIEDLREAERVAQDVAGAPRGTLKVTAPFDFARDMLAPLMPELRQRYPEIDFHLVLSQRRIDMLAEGIDVALRGGQLPDSSFVSRLIFRSSVILCANPNYLERRGRPKTVADLADHDAVCMPFPEIRFQGPDGDVVLPLCPSIVANEWGFLLRCIRDGLGLGPMISTAIRADLEAGRLEQVLPGYGIPRGGLYAVYPSRHHLSPKVRVFVDFLDEKLGQIATHCG